MKNNRFNVLDTNVILRAIINDIPSQAKKARRLFDSNERIFFISELVLAECFYVLQTEPYSFPKEQSIRLIRGILSLPRVDYDRAVIDPAIDFYAEHPALSFTDCYLKCFAENREITPVWTFDKKLVGQSGGIAKIVG